MHWLSSKILVAGRRSKCFFLVCFFPYSNEILANKKLFFWPNERSNVICELVLYDENCCCCLLLLVVVVVDRSSLSLDDDVLDEIFVIPAMVVYVDAILLVLLFDNISICDSLVDVDCRVSSTPTTTTNSNEFSLIYRFDFCFRQ